MMRLFFFLSQMTAYDVRFSDCSSDGCSSDLPTIVLFVIQSPSLMGVPDRMEANSSSCSVWYMLLLGPVYFQGFEPKISYRLPISTAIRSEEHTSELQSLMRISYAVFCLKKKNNKN